MKLVCIVTKEFGAQDVGKYLYTPVVGIVSSRGTAGLLSMLWVVHFFVLNMPVPDFRVMT